MQIKIDLPTTSIGYESDNHANAKQFLKQLELSVHHAQKSLEQMVKMMEETDKIQEVFISIRAKATEVYDEENDLSNPAELFIELNIE